MSAKGRDDRGVSLRRLADRVLGVSILALVSGCPEHRSAWLAPGSKVGAISIAFGREVNKQQAIGFGKLYVLTCRDSLPSHAEQIVWSIYATGERRRMLDRVVLGVTPVGFVQEVSRDFAKESCLVVASGEARVTLQLMRDGTVRQLNPAR